MSKTVSVNLTAQQIDMLRGVLFEYCTNFEISEQEETLRVELENILADAETEIYFG